MTVFFYNLPKNFLRCFKGYNLLWHLLAIVLTYIIVSSDLDWQYLVATRIPMLRHILFPAVILGMILPLVVPLALLALGAYRRSAVLKNTAYAIGQAAILGWVVSSLYKAFTGRIPPPRFAHTGALVDISHGFRLGILRGGVFWGWPSSHTTVAFAMALTLWQLFPDNKVVRYGAVLYAFYVGISVSMTIHWLSEFVAGAIIGAVIGVVVGRSFQNRQEDFNPHPAKNER